MEGGRALQIPCHHRENNKVFHDDHEMYRFTLGRARLPFEKKEVVVCDVNMEGNVVDDDDDDDC